MKTIVKGILAGFALTLVSAFGAQAAAVCGDGSGKAGPDDFSNSTRAAKAYFDCLNANGGIKGRPVQYLVEDNQWNPETATQLAAKLVNDRKAVLLAAIPAMSTAAPMRNSTRKPAFWSSPASACRASASSPESHDFHQRWRFETLRLNR